MRQVQAADGVAVLAGIGYFGEADDAARTGLVHKHPGLGRILVPVFLHDAGLHITGTTGREGNDHVDGLVGIGKGIAARRDAHQEQEDNEPNETLHGNLQCCCQPWSQTNHTPEDTVVPAISQGEKCRNH